MDPEKLLSQIKLYGLSVKIIDGNLHVQPREQITEQMRISIRQNKNSLIEFIEKFPE